MSCSHKILIQEAHRVDNNWSSSHPKDNRVDIRTYFSGDNGDHLVFQIDIDNRSDDPVYISPIDIELLIDLGPRNQAVYAPIRKKELITQLENIKEDLEREKKHAATSGAINTGVDVLLGVLTGGGAVGSIIVGSASAAEVMDERRRYNNSQANIDDKIKAVEEFTMNNEEVIMPGRKGSYDLNFDRLLVDADGKIRVSCSNETYISNYLFHVEKVKI